jgi:acetyltransferase-like isoleucine patch superfamily enzyme
VGGGAILLPGVVIGEESFIAAGSVMTKDALPGKVYKGVPAREFRPVPEEEMLKEEEK